MPPRIQLFYFDAGGGHAAAARALGAVLERERGPEAVIERVNLQELLDPLDPLRRWSGIRLQDCYNWLIAREWTLGLDWAARLLQATIRLRRRALEAGMASFFARTQPDLAVSLIPHFNPLLAAALARTCPAAPFVLVMTDFADPVPSFWLHGLEPGAQGSPDLVVCGTRRALDQARAEGLDENRLLAASGMILRPAFHAPPPAGFTRAEARASLRLSPTLPTALVLAGGAGSRRMLEVADRLERVEEPLQAIYLCGNNPELAAELRRRRGRHPCHVEGFTENVPDFMRLADFLIGKPGPGSLSEALCMGLPAIVVSNARTLPQERYNALWLAANGLGLSLRSWKEVDAAVARLLRPGVLDSFRRRAAMHSNRAVFEISAAIAALLDGSRPNPPQ